MAEDAEQAAAAPVRAESRKGGGFALALIILLLLGGGFFQYYRANQLAAALDIERASSKQLRDDLTEARREANEATTRFNELTKERLPVSVAFRRDSANSGIVAYFKNEAPTTVEVAAVLNDPTSGRRQQVRLVLAPEGLQQIGPQQGWSFTPGQHVRLIHGVFGTADFVVPAE